MYLIYVFCFVVASMASLGQLAEVDLGIVVFLVGTVIGSLVLHALLCRIFNIDSDTFMVTSVACGKSSSTWSETRLSLHWQVKLS